MKNKIFRKSLVIGLGVLFLSLIVTPILCTQNESYVIIYSEKQSNYLMKINGKAEDVGKSNSNNDYDTTGLSPTAPWPMFHHDPCHTGNSPFIGPGFLDLKWKFSTGGPVKSSPAVGDKNNAGYYMIYVGSDDNWVYAIEDKGSTFSSIEWVSELGSPSQNAPFRSSPAIGDVESDNSMYIGSDDNFLYNMQHVNYPSKGALYWRCPTTGRIQSSPVVEYGGDYIYVGCNNNYIYAVYPWLYPSDFLWEYGTDGPVRSSPAVKADVGLVVGSDDGYVYALGYSSMPPFEQWVSPSGHAGFKTDGPVRSSPAISSWTMSGWANVVYVGSDDNYVYCIKWTIPPPPTGCGYALMWRYETGGPVRSSPAVADLIDYNDDGILDSVVVIGSNDGHIYALAGETPNPAGQLLWQYPDPGDPPIGPVESSPAIDRFGRVYVGSNDKNIYMLDGKTGEFLDKFQTDGPVTSSPAIGPDYTIYVGSDDWNIYALRGVNNPPFPPTIIGPAAGEVGIEYYYEFEVLDPEGDHLDLIIDWDDGTIITKGLISGDTIIVPHVWNITGTYVIKAHAQDEHGLSGPEATLPVTMPRNRHAINTPLSRFLQQHTNLFSVLRFLIQVSGIQF